MVEYQREIASLPPKERQRQRARILDLDMSETRTYATHPVVIRIQYTPQLRVFSERPPSLESIEIHRCRNTREVYQGRDMDP